MVRYSSSILKSNELVDSADCVCLLLAFCFFAASLCKLCVVTRQAYVSTNCRCTYDFSELKSIRLCPHVNKQYFEFSSFSVCLLRLHYNKPFWHAIIKRHSMFDGEANGMRTPAPKKHAAAEIESDTTHTTRRNHKTERKLFTYLPNCLCDILLLFFIVVILVILLFPFIYFFSLRLPCNFLLLFIPLTAVHERVSTTSVCTHFSISSCWFSAFRLHNDFLNSAKWRTVFSVRLCACTHKHYLAPIKSQMFSFVVALVYAITVHTYKEEIINIHVDRATFCPLVSHFLFPFASSS